MSRYEENRKARANRTKSYRNEFAKYKKLVSSKEFGVSQQEDIDSLLMIRKNKREYEKMSLVQFEDAPELMRFFEQSTFRAESMLKVMRRFADDSDQIEWAMGEYKDTDAMQIHKVYQKVDSGTAVGDVLTYMDKMRDELELSGALELSSSIKNCKRTRRFNEEGGELDIDRVMEGSEDYWMQTKRDGKQEFLRIVINMSLSCGNSGKVHAKLLASGLVTAETLEKMGYGVEIYVGYFGKTDHERGWMLKVKDCTEHMDEQRIASLGCAGMQRTFSFAIWEHLHNRLNHRCSETSDEMIQFCGADVMVGQQWTKDGEQIEMIKKAVLKIAEGR